MFLYFSGGSHDLIEDNKEHLSHDPEDAKWDYFREESLLHVFHSLLHKTWEGNIKANESNRLHELFFYAHQQMIRR